MKISIIGSGYVGLVTGAGFAKLGHNVICIDIDKKRVDMINKGKPPIYEKGLAELLPQLIEAKTLTATTKFEEIKKTDISFVAVPTPPRKDGSVDVSYIEKACSSIGKILKKKKKYHLVVIKSTVIPGTTENVAKKALEKSSGKKAGRDFGAAVNPEFLREGSALEDFLNPDRVVIGSENKKSESLLLELYKNFDCPIVKTDLKTAEMIKYASNSFLAVKISLTNEIGNICKILGIDTYKVMEGVGLDKRVGSAFLKSGVGFGGSCFPKDVLGLVAIAKQNKYKPNILEAVLTVNDLQPKIIIKMLEQKLNPLTNKRIAILGLAFKSDTDDIRESRSVPIINELVKKKAKVVAYDPMATENMKKIFKNIQYVNSVKEALVGADACLVLTDWDEFKKLEDKDFNVMSKKIIIEGRKVLNPSKVRDFEGICW